MNGPFESAVAAREAALPMVEEAAASLGLTVTDVMLVGRLVVYRAGALVVTIRPASSYRLGGLHDAVVQVNRSRDYGDDGNEHLELREFRSARTAVAYVRRTVPSLAVPR